MKAKMSMYTPKNPAKYKGDPTRIVARSNLERTFFNIIDTNSAFKYWMSEEIFVPYFSPVDQKMHRYFVDLIVEMQTGKKIIIEIKPDSQTRPPKMRKNKKTYINEAETWAVNEAKWLAAKKWAEERGMEFMIITEKNLPRTLNG